MKLKIFLTTIFLLIFLSITQFVNGEVVHVVEKHNNYVIQNSVISPSALNEIINNQDVKILFIQSNGLPNSFLPYTRVIQLKDIITKVNGISYIAPKEQIDLALSKVGLSDEDTIILYDVGNTPYVTRLFWTLKVYGHEFVKVLNGGLNAWNKMGYKTVENSINPKKSAYTAHDKNENMIGNLENIKEAMNNENEVIVDVRSPEEFAKGHIPTAVNIPYQKALRNDGLFKSFEDLQKVYENKGVLPEKSMIYVYCSSGIRASFTYFVLHELMGYNNVKVYDGSYMDYLKKTKN